MSLFGGDYLDAVLAAVEQAKTSAEKNIVLGIIAGLTQERLLKKVCHRHSWGKTCQKLVDKKIIQFDECRKMYTLCRKIDMGHVEKCTLSRTSIHDEHESIQLHANCTKFDIDENLTWTSTDPISLKKTLNEYFDHVASLISGFLRTSNEIQKCVDRTNAFRRTIQDVITASRAMVDEQKRYLESIMTGLERYEARLKNIDKLLDLPGELERQQRILQTSIDNTRRAMREAERNKNKDLAETLKQQLAGLNEDRETLRKRKETGLHFRQTIPPNP